MVLTVAPISLQNGFANIQTITDNTTAVKKVFDELAPRYANRNGGYTRILKLAERRGDDALMVILELVEEDAK